MTDDTGSIWSSVLSGARQVARTAYEESQRQRVRGEEAEEDDEDEGEDSSDEERGQRRRPRAAAEQPFNWLRAAEVIGKQVGEAADTAKSRFAEASGGADDASSAFRSTVTGGLSSMAAGLSSAASTVQEKGKGLRESVEAAEAAVKGKARATSDKISQATKGAKDGVKSRLSTAQDSVASMTTLTMSPARLLQFGGLFLVGLMLMSMSFSFLPLLAVQPQKFALLFAAGSTVTMVSFGMLRGWTEFSKSLLQTDKLPFSMAYIVGLVGTLVATLAMQSYLLTIVFGAIQAFSLMYFMASFIPGGQALLNFLGRSFWLTFSWLVQRLKPY